MGQKTAYLENALLSQSFGALVWTPPDTWYVVLSTDPFDVNTTGSGVTEPGSNYFRHAVPNTPAEWAAPSGSNPSSTANLNDWVFPDPAADWGTIQSVYLCDAPNGGNLCYGTDVSGGGALVGVGGRFTVPAGAFLVRES